MKDEKGRFKKGHSGNPKGKAPGTRHKATQAALSLLDGEAEALSRKAVEMALQGDTAALRLCLERIAPAAKERPLSGIDLPEINAPVDVLEAVNQIAKALAQGEVLPSEATTLCGVLEQCRRHFETADLEERIATLEKAASARY